MSLDKIKTFFNLNKKTLLYTIFFIITYSFLYDGAFAFTASELEDLKNSTATITEWLLKWVSMIVALLTYLATIFLSPSWLNGSLFGLNGYFKEIWIRVSNVVYFVFAFLLIWIAFMNIIWKNADQYQLKQALPKFIVWVLIVPFSWFLVQFILSISAILTVSALSLPFSTFDEYETKLGNVKVPQTLVLDLSTVLWTATWSTDAWAATEWTATNNDKNINGFIRTEWKTIPLTDITWWEGSASTSIFWIISMYTYWILSLDTIDDVKAADFKSIQNLWDLIVKLLFDVVFVLIYSILIIALWLVLMIRWIYIWIYTMMSPVFWLMYFFDKKDWWGDWFFAKFNLKDFISLAMVPVYTMLALSFWLLFLYVIWTWMQVWDWWGNSDVKITDNTLSVWWDNGFQLKIEWTTWSIDSTTWLMASLWITWLWIVWSLILKVFGIVVLWWAIMAALRSSEITKTIVQPLHDFGSKVWQIATTAPANIPIFGGQSMNSASDIAWKYNQTIWQKSVDRANKYAENSTFLSGNSQITKELSTINNRVVNYWEWESNSVKTLRSDYEALIKSAQWDSTKALSTAWLDTAKIIWDKFNIDTKWFKNGTEEQIANTVIKKFEWKLDGSTVTGLTNKFQKESWVMWKNEVKDFFKNISTGTAEANNSRSANNEVNISLESRFFNDGKLTLKSWAVDNVARKVYNKLWVNNYTEEDFRGKLSELLEPSDIDSVIKHIQEELVPENAKLFKDK